MGEIIPDNYKKYYLKGYSGDLTNFCLYKTCCGQPWRIDKKKKMKKLHFVWKFLRNLETYKEKEES